MLLDGRTWCSVFQRVPCRRGDKKNARISKKKQCAVTAYNPQLTGSNPAARGGNIGTEEPALVAGPLNFEVTVKYVRREIRSLTDQDREMFLNAVSVLQRVPSSIGQDIYGGNYYSKDYLTRLHLYYGTCLLAFWCTGSLLHFA